MYPAWHKKKPPPRANSGTWGRLFTQAPYLAGLTGCEVTIISPAS